MYIYIYRWDKNCYPFGSSTDPFSQDPTSMATPFQNEPNGKRNKIKSNSKLIEKGAQSERRAVQNEEGSAPRGSKKHVANMHL